MSVSKKLTKYKRRIGYEVVQRLKHTFIYPKIYKSYWHSLFYRSNKSSATVEKNYFTAMPNPGAGIGHQLANWISGYWYAKKFGLQFAHTPFSVDNWEAFLGFGEDEISVGKLAKEGNHKKVRLPLFDEHNDKEVALIKNIISSYEGNNVVFVAELDQPYEDQCGVIEDIKRKFYQAKGRPSDKLIYSKNNFNIAIHVRRGDIANDTKNKIPNLSLRWQGNSYFENVLSMVTRNLKVAKPIAIFLFSQGKREEFKEFEKFENIHFCLDMNAQDSFLHMLSADLLITSKSSFSYKSALLNKGIKVCPKDFWHGYPNTKDWILVEKDGSFAVELLNT